MSAIGPGDFVECVTTRWLHKPGGFFWEFSDAPELLVGAVYRVREVNSSGGVSLAGFPLTHPYDGYNARRFSRLYTPKASIIQVLRLPAPDVQVT